jgi:hypothetical protein
VGLWAYIITNTAFKTLILMNIFRRQIRVFKANNFVFCGVTKRYTSSAFLANTSIVDFLN